MQVRVFESQDMTSGLQKIRRELGPEALILSTKTVRGSGFGIKGKPMLEITAAIDDLPAVNRDTPHSAHMTGNSGYPTTSPAVRNTTSGGGRFRQVVDDNIEDLLHTATTDDSVGKPFFPHTVEQKRQTRNSAGNKKSGEQEQTATELYEEVRQLKKLINGLSSQLQETISRKTPQKPPQQITAVLQQKQTRTHSPKNPLLRQILERGIEAETARTLANFLEANYNKEELLDPHDVTAKLVEITRNLIEVAPPQFDNCDKQQRIAFVGPTGVGKTTTLAKVCAHYLATKSKSVALITIDTYRIAAVEQLKIYGEIMGLPVDVVFTPEQMKAALHRHRDKELVLIDTAGRSPRDPYNIDELSSFLNAEMNIANHLVLSATTREEELMQTINEFRRLGLARTIFTKLDECFTLGVLLNIQLQNPVPLSWLANGQRVPEDLLHISAKKVAELIMTDTTTAA